MSIAELSYLYVNANEQNKQLQDLLEKAKAEIEELRQEVTKLKEAHGSTTPQISAAPNC